MPKLKRLREVPNAERLSEFPKTKRPRGRPKKIDTSSKRASQQSRQSEIIQSKSPAEDYQFFYGLEHEETSNSFDAFTNPFLQQLDSCRKTSKCAESSDVNELEESSNLPKESISKQDDSGCFPIFIGLTQSKPDLRPRPHLRDEHSHPLRESNLCYDESSSAGSENGCHTDKTNCDYSTPRSAFDEEAPEAGIQAVSVSSVPSAASVEDGAAKAVGSLLNEPVVRNQKKKRGRPSKKLMQQSVVNHPLLRVEPAIEIIVENVYLEEVEVQKSEQKKLSRMAEKPLRKDLSAFWKKTKDCLRKDARYALRLCDTKLPKQFPDTCQSPDSSGLTARTFAGSDTEATDESSSIVDDAERSFADENERGLYEGVEEESSKGKLEENKEVSDGDEEPMEDDAEDVVSCHEKEADFSDEDSEDDIMAAVLDEPRASNQERAYENATGAMLRESTAQLQPRCTFSCSDTVGGHEAQRITDSSAMRSYQGFGRSQVDESLFQTRTIIHSAFESLVDDAPLNTQLEPHVEKRDACCQTEPVQLSVKHSTGSVCNLDAVPAFRNEESRHIYQRFVRDPSSRVVREFFEQKKTGISVSSVNRNCTADRVCVESRGTYSTLSGQISRCSLPIREVQDYNKLPDFSQEYSSISPSVTNTYQRMHPVNNFTNSALPGQNSGFSQSAPLDSFRTNPDPLRTAKDFPVSARSDLSGMEKSADYSHGMSMRRTVEQNRTENGGASISAVGQNMSLIGNSNSKSREVRVLKCEGKNYMVMASPGQQFKKTVTHLTSATSRAASAGSSKPFQNLPVPSIPDGIPDAVRKAASNLFVRPAEESDSADDEPIYVNPKQYARIVKRREARLRMEAEGRITSKRKKYMHESRHLQALRRHRECRGKFKRSRRDEDADDNPSSSNASDNNA